MGNDILMGLALWTVISALGLIRGYQLHQAVLGGLVVAAVLLTLIVFLLPMPEPRATPTSAASYEHRLVVNPAGVQHHYFEGRQPPLDWNDPVPDVNRALQFLDLHPVSSRPTETRRGHMTWHEYGEGRLTVYEVSCTHRAGSCIQKVMVTPSRRDMMRNQAEGRANQQFISEDEIGREWPFTVPFGIVSCRGISEVYFIADDRTSYPANGKAMSAQPDGPDIRTIWRDVSPGAGATGKVSMHPVIQTGLALCR